MAMKPIVAYPQHTDFDAFETPRVPRTVGAAVAGCTCQLCAARAQPGISARVDPPFALHPQIGFSGAIPRLTSTQTGGHPAGRDFQGQKRRKAVGCRPIKVAGFTMIKARRPARKRASFSRTKRSATVVLVAFFSRSENKASCLRRNRFSVAGAVRLRNRAAQKPRASAIRSVQQ